MPLIPYIRMRASNPMANGLTHRLEPLSQTLFSAHLIAEVLPRIWKLDPTEGESRLNELCQLTSNALVEMDDLLDELWGINMSIDGTLTRTNEEN